MELFEFGTWKRLFIRYRILNEANDVVDFGESLVV